MCRDCRDCRDDCRPKSKKGSKKVRLISQCDFDERCGVLTLKRSGPYAFKCNLKGRIIIAADNVCLDLCCFKLDACGNPVAIEATDRTHIRVFNGSVYNTSQDGLKFTSCQDVVLRDLTLRYHLLNAVHLTTSNGVLLTKLDVSQSNRGLLSETTNDLRLESSDFYKNHFEITTDEDLFGFLEFVGGTNISLVDVNVTENEFVSFLLEYTYSAVSLVTVSNVELIRTKVNSNTYSGEDAFYEGYYNLFNENVVFKDCEFNNNPAGYYGMEVFAVYVSNNVVIDGCRCNNNSVSNGVWFNGVYAPLAVNLIIKNSQFNRNSVTGEGSEASVVFVDIRSPGLIIDNCQVNGNSSPLSTIGILARRFKGAVITNTQCNDNYTDEGAGVGGAGAAGIVIEVSNSEISNCQTNGNYAKGPGNSDFNSIGVGILIVTRIQETAPWENIVIRECEASGNGLGTSDKAAGIFNGFLNRKDDTAYLNPCRNVKILDCVADGNASELLYSAGILSEGDNTVIRNCSATGNKCNQGPAYGIWVNGSELTTPDRFVTNAVVQNCQVYETSSTDGEAVGISINNVKQADVDGNISHSAQSTNASGYGFLFSGSTDLSSVQDSIARGNSTYGFADEATFTNSFFGNKAEANGASDVDNFKPDIQHVTFDKAVKSFDTVPNKWSNVSIKA